MELELLNGTGCSRGLPPSGVRNSGGTAWSGAEGSIGDAVAVTLLVGGACVCGVIMLCRGRDHGVVVLGVVVRWRGVWNVMAVAAVSMSWTLQVDVAGRWVRAVDWFFWVTGGCSRVVAPPRSL